MSLFWLRLRRIVLDVYDQMFEGAPRHQRDLLFFFGTFAVTGAEIVPLISGKPMDFDVAMLLATMMATLFATAASRSVVAPNWDVTHLWPLVSTAKVLTLSGALSMFFAFGPVLAVARLVRPVVGGPASRLQAWTGNAHPQDPHTTAVIQRPTCL